LIQGCSHLLELSVLQAMMVKKSGKYYVICHNDAGVKAPSVHRGASAFLYFLNFVT
jgi:hypothetical protein